MIKTEFINDKGLHLHTRLQVARTAKVMVVALIDSRSIRRRNRPRTQVASPESVHFPAGVGNGIGCERRWRRPKACDFTCESVAESAANAGGARGEGDARLGCLDGACSR